MAAKAAITEPTIWRHIFETARSISLEHWAIVMILYETGMHIDSLVKLKPDAIQGARLVWQRPKATAKHRMLQYPMTKPLAFALHEFFKHPRKSRQMYWKMVKAVGKRAGHPSLAPMTFRHSRAVRLLQKGLPAAWVEAAMGASMKVITSAYGSLTDDQMLEVLRKSLD